MKLKPAQILALLMLFAVLSSPQIAAHAAQKAKAQRPANQPPLSTDVKFNDHQVGGKYQKPFETLSIVENEKRLDELIGVRRDFQDRIQQTQEMR